MTDLYRIYRDQTFFRYAVVITRDDEENGIVGERYILMVSVLSVICFWIIRSVE